MEDSLTRKPVGLRAALIGAAIGVVFTMAIEGLVALKPVAPHAFFDLLFVLNAWPSWVVCKAFGWELYLHSSKGFSLPRFLLMIITNALLLAFIVAISTLFLRLFQPRRRR